MSKKPFQCYWLAPFLVNPRKTTRSSPEEFPILINQSENSRNVANDRLSLSFCLQKLYTVPPYTMDIPHTRVNHNKFMVTESVAYFGTSNWAGDYFLYTGGIGYVINETETGKTVRTQLQAVFERNWNSNYTSPVICQD